MLDKIFDCAVFAKSALVLIEVVICSNRPAPFPGWMLLCRVGRKTTTQSISVLDPSRDSSIIGRLLKRCLFTV